MSLFRAEDSISAGADTLIQYGALGIFALASLAFFWKVYRDLRAENRELREQAAVERKETIATLTEALRLLSLATDLLRRGSNGV